jgi:5-formyltetrahydrofolate cyclo-ligase
MGAMPGADDRGSKERLRREHLAARSDPAGAADRASGDAARTTLLVAALAGAGCVTCYLSVGREPDTTDLIARLDAAGCRVLLPRLRPDGGLDLVDRGPLVAGLRGIPAATGPAVDPSLADVWLVPALAVDRRGVRLGRGGGAYDRELPADRPVVALLHAGELVEALPAEPHDRPVTRVALPHALVDLPLPPAAVLPRPDEMRRVARDTP